MRHIKFDYLTYFLNGYWNQMGDEVHGSIEGAATAFCSESTAYIQGLLGDLERAEQDGLFGVAYGDSAYDSIYWSQFDRFMNKTDAAVVRRILKDCEGPGRS
ncbi:MAG TPA: hypothetical protein VF574_10470 [Allosphingosinicella sp.]|jgi:hypothetical protein